MNVPTMIDHNPRRQKWLKAFMLGVAIVIIGALPVFAEDHGDRQGREEHDNRGHGEHRGHDRDWQHHVGRAHHYWGGDPEPSVIYAPPVVYAAPPVYEEPGINFIIPLHIH